MRLESEFIRLPLSFDVEQLKQEALQFSEYEWDYHPQRYDGNTALNLVSKNGERSDSYVGYMRPTKALEVCPYIQQVMASFNTVIGRSRFMRLAPGKGVPAHSDTDYTWRNRVRIHIPIITDSTIHFVSSSGDKQVSVHMQAGEAWIFDNWREHSVINGSDIHRIHLVVDTVGTADFWELANRGHDPELPKESWADTVYNVAFEKAKAIDLPVEKFNVLSVRSPDEVTNLLSDFLFEVDYLKQEAPKRYESLVRACQRLQQDWRGQWALSGDSPEGIARYQSLLRNLKGSMRKELDTAVLKSNKVRAYDVIANWLDLCVDESQVKQIDKAAAIRSSYTGKVPQFESPVFIVAAPRSGSTMLFEALKANKELWTIGDESHQEIEGISSLHPRSRGFESNALGQSDCTDQIRREVIEAFTHRLQNVRSATYADMPPEFQPDAIRFLEKTPKNALRIPFLKGLFPDAKFVFLYRDARSNIGSIVDAWESEKFITYPDLPEWRGPKWSLLLSSNWQQLAGKGLAAIAAHQWANANATIMQDLDRLSSVDKISLSYEGLLVDPAKELRRVCEFARIPFGPKMQSFATTGFPKSKYVLTEPQKEKWKRHESEIEKVLESFAAVETELASLVL